jgi:hypothetical protein
MAKKQYSQVLAVTPGDPGTSTTSSMKGVNGMTKYRLATAALVALVALAFSNTAFAHSNATASVKTSAKACSTSYNGTGSAGFSWDHYNVDPYFPNVGDLSSYHRFIAAKGDEAASRLGIPANVWAKLKQVTPCAGFLRAGMRLDKMLSGGFWSGSIKVDSNVVVNFIGPGKQEAGPVGAWFAAVVVNGKVWVFVLPYKCGNASLIVRIAPTTPTPAIPPKKPKKPKVGYVWITKVAKDASGNKMPTPTNTFIFQKISGGLSTKLVYNHAPQGAGTCTIGKSVSMNELAPLAGQWISETSNNQSMTCTAKTTFVFIDREAPTPTTPTQTCEQKTGVQGSYEQGGVCVVNSCGNVIVINGNNNNVNVGGNCNNTPPTPPTCVYGGTYPNCNQPPTPTCQYGGTYPNCNTPPTPVTLVLSNLTNPQNGTDGVYADGGLYRNICVTVQGKAGDTIKLTYGAALGSFQTSIFTITSTGTDRHCDAVYKSPLDAAAVGKTETLTVSGTDVTANVNSNSVTTSFVLQQPKTRP